MFLAHVTVGVRFALIESLGGSSTAQYQSKRLRAERFHRTNYHLEHVIVLTLVRKLLFAASQNGGKNGCGSQLPRRKQCLLRHGFRYEAYIAYVRCFGTNAVFDNDLDLITTYAVHYRVTAIQHRRHTIIFHFRYGIGNF